MGKPWLRKIMSWVGRRGQDDDASEAGLWEGVLETCAMLRDSHPSSEEIRRDIERIEASVDEPNAGHVALVERLVALAERYDVLEQWENNRRVIECALKLSEHWCGPHHRQTVLLGRSLLQTLVIQGEWREATLLGTKVVKAASAHLGDDDYATIQARDLTAQAYLYQGQARNAIVYSFPAVEACQNWYGVHDERTIKISRTLCRAYRESGDLKQALLLSTKLVDVLLAEDGKALSPMSVSVQLNRLTLLEEMGRLEGEEAFGASVLAKCKKVFGDADPRTMRCMWILLPFYLGVVGRETEEEALLRELVDATTAYHGDVFAPDSLKARQMLCLALHRRRQWKAMLAAACAVLDMLDLFAGLDRAEQEPVAPDGEAALLAVIRAFKSVYEARAWRTAAALGKPLVRTMVKIHGGTSKESEQILLLRDIAVLQSHEVGPRSVGADQQQQQQQLKRDRSAEPRPPRRATPIKSILKKESSFHASLADAAATATAATVTAAATAAAVAATADATPARPRRVTRDGVAMRKSMPTVGSLFSHSLTQDRNWRASRDAGSTTTAATAADAQRSPSLPRDHHSRLSKKPRVTEIAAGTDGALRPRISRDSSRDPDSDSDEVLYIPPKNGKLHKSRKRSMKTISATIRRMSSDI